MLRRHLLLLPVAILMVEGLRLVAAGHSGGCIHLLRVVAAGNHSAADLRHGAVRAPRECSVSPAVARIVPLRRGARGGAHARAAAHGGFRDARPGRPAHGEPGSETYWRCGPFVEPDVRKPYPGLQLWRVGRTTVSVIASAAKQSSSLPQKKVWIASLRSQ